MGPARTTYISFFVCEKSCPLGITGSEAVCLQKGELFMPARTRGSRLIQVELSSTPATRRGSRYKQAHTVGKARAGHTSGMMWH
eukprot:1147131-Pelagomonas_calceolata.AAC.3